MKITVLLYLTVFLLLGAAVSAQLSDDSDIRSIKRDYTGLKPAESPFSLIDLSRIQWSHSYSVSFFSGGGQSGSLGMYTGSLFYEFSRSLSMNIRLGIAHNPGSLFNSNVSNDAMFYPAVNLDFHPSENFSISVGFASYPGIYYNPLVHGGGYFGRYLR
jgi:hypothetical protein